MLRDNLVGLIEPMRNGAGADPLALSIQQQASDDRSICLENPRPEGAESSLTENVTSPFQAEPAHSPYPSAYFAVLAFDRREKTAASKQAQKAIPIKLQMPVEVASTDLLVTR